MDGKTNNSAYREPAQMLKDIRSAVEALKRQTSTPRLMEFAPGSILSQYRLEPGILVALVNLNMIKMEGKPGARVRKFQFTYGVEPISDQVIQNVYDAYRSVQSRRKAESTANAAKRRGELSVVKTNPIAKTTVKPQAKSTKATKPAIIGTSVEHYSSQLRKSPFENIKGTIFAFKQLSFMKFLPLRKPSEILIDKRFTISNVELITFTVEKSKLVVSFYMDPLGKDFTIPTTLCGRIEMDNVVLALLDRTVDSTQTGAIEITTVPVKDPYNLKDY